MRISDIASEDVYTKAIIYAPFGAGKTQLCGTAAEHQDMRDVLLMRCEDGKATITHQQLKMTPRIASIKEARDLFWDLANKRKAKFKNAEGETEEYDYSKVRTLIIDSGTAMLQTTIEEVVAKNCKDNPGKDPDRVTIRDWGDANFILTKLFRQFFDLPMNVLLTALVREDYNTDDPDARMRRGPVLCRPDFNPKLANRVMAFADFVWWISVKGDGTRILHTQPDGAWVAKTRGDIFAGKLPSKIPNPTLPKIYNLLRSVQPKEKDDGKKAKHS
jgi:hypothetical protein